MPSTVKKQSLFQKISLYFFRRPRKTAIIWVFIAVFGIASYSTLLKREGFPSIETPFAQMQGAYIVNDPSKVDKDVSKPLSDFLLKQSGVKSVQTQSFDNLYLATISYQDNVNAETRSAELQKAISDQHILPSNASGKLEAFKFGFTSRGDDLTVAFYQNEGSPDTKQLATKASQAAAYLKSKNLSLVQDVSIIDPFESVANPLTGQTEETQKSFDRFATRQSNATNFYNSIVIGVKAKDGADELELDKQVRGAVEELNKQKDFSSYSAAISGTNATSINDQISELQKTLLEGLLAVLIIGSIVIAIRASLITVLSMITVITAVLGLFFVIGYSLNTITLFGLILGLSLIVDDTIIMVEAIDAQRRRKKDPTAVLETATSKVGQAMIAATTTAALSFAPLLFVGGILGSFIRAIPITIISALLISLLVALVFIPLFSRYLLLGKKHLGNDSIREPAAGIEARIARLLSTPMLWAKHSRKKLVSVGVVAVLIGFSFIGAGGFLFQKVKFSIFPSDKDSNQISVTLTFEPGTSIQRAEEITDALDQQVGQIVGQEFIQATYYGTGTIQSATANIDLTNYEKRSTKAPEIIDQINTKLKNFEGTNVKSSSVGPGGPASAFSARVDASQNREGAIRLATDIANFLQTTELKRTDGSVAKIDAVTKPNPGVYNRDASKAYVDAGATFVDDDTSALVTIAKDAVKKEFPEKRIASYGLSKDALNFDFGQEDDNQDSFKTLALAFPALLVVIYFLLALQFRSLLQPLLIFTAIPFSLFGITLGLYVTDNPFSFFAMLGFFALIGLSIKNTILLTDYANQSRRAGMDAVDAAHEALAERFRPLIATSLTAVVSLIPLAITSPFWEGLAFVLIFGLLSSTFLVITVFPYYYLGAEFLRTRINRATGLTWLVTSVLLAVGLSKIAAPLALIAPIAVAVAITAYKRSSNA